MSFKLADHWVWDHWIFNDRDSLHLFYLRAPRALLDPERRHRRAAIGHAISKDGRSWRQLPDALVHSDRPAFDDMATWTGSAIRHPDGHIRLFYTGCSHGEDGQLQRIGWADSRDGIVFERMTQTPLEPDPRWYETLDNYEWHDVAWRDPYVFHHPEDGRWHMLITARAKDGDPRYRGVVGHAVSDDLDSWEILPPLSSPGHFGQMEVLQQHTIEGQNHLVFSVDRDHVDLSTFPDAQTAGWIVKGVGPLGPWDYSTARPVRDSSLYAGQLAELTPGRWFYTGFRNEIDGRFIGDIPDPIPFDQV